MGKRGAQSPASSQASYKSSGAESKGKNETKSSSSHATDKGDKLENKGSTTESRSKSELSESIKRGSIVKKALTVSELRAIAKAKAEGGEAWEAAKARVRARLAPKEAKSKSTRANTAMPVAKLKKRLHEALPNGKRCTTEAAVVLAAALDYAVSELVDNACQACELKKQRTITPRHIKIGVPQDESLAALFHGVTIPQGGTIPTFHPELAQGYRTRKKRGLEEHHVQPKDDAQSMDSSHAKTAHSAGSSPTSPMSDSFERKDKKVDPKSPNDTNV